MHCSNESTSSRISLKLGIAALFALGLMLNASASLAQAAYLPSVQIGTAALISTTTADSYYGSSTTSTNGPGAPTARPPELVELARALKSNPDLIYEYVRNNIEVVWEYGLQKGALGASIDKSGTPFDQAALMVELLRQSGYTATYLAGTITLSGADFYSWTGINDSHAACQLLANGGIAGSVNGSTSMLCASGAGSALTSVTLSHVWVQVTINGTNYVFDPSFKPHTWKSGINLSSATGLVSGQALSQATSGMDSGTLSGVSYVHQLNASALNSKLQTYSSNLLSYLQSHNLAAAQIEDVVSGSVITPYISPSGGLRQTQLPYQGSSVAHTWAGNVPDQYRTTLQVQGYMWNYTVLPAPGAYETMFDKTFYVDEIYGRALRIDTDYGIFEQDKYANTVTLTLDGATLATYVDPGIIYQPGVEASSRAAPAYIILTANHPYASSADGSVTAHGDYMDAAVTKPVVLISSLTIVHGWGDAGGNLFTKWADERADDKRTPLTGSQCSYDGFCADYYFGSQGDFEREKMAANWLAQYTRSAHLHAAIAGSVVQLHHVLGAAYGDGKFTVNYPYGPSEPQAVTFPLSDNFNRLDVDSGLSLVSKTADPIARRAALQGIAASAAALEGSVSAQMDDLPDTTSTATRFEWANTPPGTAGNSDPTYEDPSGVGPRKFLQFTSDNASAAAGLMLAEGQASTTADGLSAWSDQPELGSGEADIWKFSLSSEIMNYANAGYTVVAAQEAFLGPGQRGGVISPETLVNGFPVNYTHVHSKQRGGALVATLYDGNDDPLQIAHVVIALLPLADGTYTGTKGGGGSAQSDQGVKYDPANAADILKSHFIDRANALGVNLTNGSLAFTSPATLSVGNGGFPYELAGQFSWRAGANPMGFSGPVVPTSPQNGWAHNWQNWLTMSGSGMEAMGKSDVRAAVNTIAAFLAVQDIYKAAQSPQREVAAVLSQAWWAHQLNTNVVTVTLGRATQQFVESTPGQWISPGAGTAAQLVQTGGRTAYEDICRTAFNWQLPPYALSRGWDISGMSFTVTNPHGDVQTFSPWLNKYHTNDYDMCGTLQGFRLTSWSFPQGVSVNLTYAVPADSGDPIDVLTKVTNSLGREIDFSPDGFVLTDAANTSRTLTHGAADDESNTTDTDPVGAVTTFTYTPAMGASATQRPVPYQELNQVFTADNATVANVQYDYDTLGRINQVEDAEHLQVGDRNPYSFLIADGTRGERDDPLGGAYTVVYDTYGHPSRFLDELARETDAVFDSRGRVVSYTYPEGDCEVFGYDDHNNTASYKRVDKTSACNVNAGASHMLSVSASWDQSWNKPLTIVNARGKTTTFTYYASGNGASLLHTATRPDPDGGGPLTAPVYSFTYDAKGKLLTSTDPIAVVVTNAYDAAENLTSTVLDSGSGHVNSTTSFTYDAQGDVATTTDPRSNVTGSLYDLDRRKVQDLHHDGNGSATLNAASRTTYDAVGRIIKTEAGTVFAGTSVTTWVTTDTKTYTPTGKVATDMDGDNRTTTTAYDGLDRVLTVTDPVSRQTHFVYDAAGETLTEQRAYGSALQENYASYTYSPNGKQASVQDALGSTHTTAFTYDGFDRLNHTTFPDATYEALTYDEDGDVTARVNRSGQQLTYTYDNLDRLLTKASPSPAVTIYTSYLANGLTDKVCDTSNCATSGNVIDYGYDTAGRLTSALIRIPGLSGSKTIGYALDAAGNRTGLTWPDSYAVTYSYDSLNRMATAVNGGTTLATYAYDPLSRRTNLAYGGGASMAYGWSVAGDLTALNHDFSGTANDVAYTLAYTNAHQLASNTIGNAAYRFVPGANGTDTYATANNLNQYPSITPAGGSAQTLTYDTRGNLTGDGTFTYTYDAENRLLTANKTGVAATYVYDPLGRRTKKSGTGVTTTYFVDDGDNEIAEYNSSGSLVTRYVPGPAIDDPIAMVTSGGTTTYFHEDKTGSVIAMSGASAALTEGPYTYDAYGTVSASTGVAFKFTGRRLDPETGLYYYRARYYSSALGRFMQTDGVGYSAGMNLYAYIGNDPIDRVDPSGNGPEIVGCLAAGPGAPLCAAVDIAATIFVVGGAAIVGSAVLHSDAPKKDDAAKANDGKSDIKGDKNKDQSAAQGSRRPTNAQAEKARQRSKDAEGKERCYYCGRETTREPGKPNSSEIEHKQPYSKGGKTEDSNLENACRTCNRSKGSQTEEEYRNQQQPDEPEGPDNE